MRVPIIILHGWNGSIERWTPVRKLLETKGFPVHVPQIPGFVSDTPKPWTLDNYVQWLLSELDRLRFNQVILLCHSNGGRIGMKFSAKYPERVKKLVLVNSAGIRSTPSWKRDLLRIIAKAGKRITDTSFTKTLFYKFIGEHDYEKASPILRKTLVNILEEDLVPIFPQIQTPTTLIWGTQDRLTPPQSGRSLHQAIPQSILLWIEGAKHSLPFTHPEELVQLVERDIAKR